jgi:hypothetical protein
MSEEPVGVDETGPLLTCLLPVRNAAHELPAFFDSLRRYCDAVVALDDGSTDDTLAILEAEPLVKRIVRMPVREGYRSWNDATNRNRLLREVRKLNPRWILSLDADERIDEEDGQALRAFLERDAMPGLAYAFRHAPMWGSTEYFWPRYYWGYRLFHFARGQQFPVQKLHFSPVPTSIPEALRIKTTLRIQHLGEMTPERRLARFVKYLEADPARKFQASYTSSLQLVDEQHLHRWLPRPFGLPVLLDEAELALRQPPQDGQTAMSVVILAPAGAGDVRKTIESISLGEPVDIVVVTRGWSNRQVEQLREAVADIKVVPVPGDAHPGVMRNVGLRCARGIHITFLDAGEQLVSPGLAGWLDVHRQGYVMVSGVLVPGANDAVTIAGTSLRSRDGSLAEPPHELVNPPVRCSYARLVLLEAGGFPEGVRAAEGTIVNGELFRRGYRAWFDPGLRISMPATPHRLTSFLAHSFASGRDQTRRRVRAAMQRSDSTYAPATYHKPAWRIGRGSLRSALPTSGLGWRVTALVTAGRLCEVLGAGLEGLRSFMSGQVGVRRRPQAILCIGMHEGGVSAWLVQCDYLQRRLTAVQVATSLRVNIPRGSAPISLDELPSVYRSLEGDQIHAALVEAVGVEGLDSLVGQSEAVEKILMLAGAGSRLRPQAARHLAEALDAGAISSSLARRDFEFMQRWFG